MKEAEKVKFIRAALIEQERLKLKTAQGKRMIPVLLDVLDNLNDIEYVSFFRHGFFSGFSYFSILALRWPTPRTNPSRGSRKTTWPRSCWTSPLLRI